MRSQRILRTSSSQNVCVFCACRLGGDAAIPVAQRRPFNSASNASWSAANGAARREGDTQSQSSDAVGAPSNNGGWGQAFGGKPGLSAAEEREREALRARFAAPAPQQTQTFQIRKHDGRSDVRARRDGESFRERFQPARTQQPRSFKKLSLSRNTDTVEPQAQDSSARSQPFQPVQQPYAPPQSTGTTPSSAESQAWGKSQASTTTSGLSVAEEREKQALQSLFASQRANAPQRDDRGQDKYGRHNNTRGFRRVDSGSQYRLNLNPSTDPAAKEDPFNEDVASNWSLIRRRTRDNGSQQGQDGMAEQDSLSRFLRKHERSPLPTRKFEANHAGKFIPLRTDDRAASSDEQGRYRPMARGDGRWGARGSGRTEDNFQSVRHIGSDLTEAESATLQVRADHEKKVQAEREEKLSREERLRQSRLERLQALAAEEEVEERPAKGRKKGRQQEERRPARRDEYDEDEEDYEEYLERIERRKSRKQKKSAAPTPISLPEYVSVANLASALRVRFDLFVRKMEELGYEGVQADHVLNFENASLIAMEYNFEPIVDEGAEELDLQSAPEPEDKSALPPRPPVVTIMGHVDHGKTTILDYLRQSSVAATEFGGITQHIGAFSVPLSSGKTITFLDTPGHAAFLSMRQRGANVTDIVVLVVAADDSVKPQTLEAIKHAQNARVPIIVAINKIDKEEAAPERVKQDLARHGVEVEDFGGDTQVVCVSGKTGQGMQELEEAVVTLSEILDYRAERDGAVEGWVLEAKLKKSGRVATVLVRRGTLKLGDVLVAGSTWAKVRALRNEAGVDIDEVGPGMPVEVDGWRDMPAAGDEVLQAPDEQKATSVVEYRQDQQERQRMSKDMEAIDKLRRQEAEKRAAEKAKERAAKAAAKGNAVAEAEEEAAATEETTDGPIIVSFIVKADVSGSAEAVVDSISAIGNNEVQARVLRSGVGAVSEFDVEHAAAAGGHIVSFNTRIDPAMRQLAEERGVRVLDQNIIYRLVDDVKAALTERLPPIVSQRVLGEADIAQTFTINVKARQTLLIAGCKVRNGVVAKNGRVKVLRGTEVIYDGTISSLKSAKKEVPEMRKGTECGLAFDGGWQAFAPGDQVQCYEEVREKRYL